MNPARAHWLRMALWLFLASPVIAALVAATTDAPWQLAIFMTLYMWLLVCVILALIALVALVGRLLGRGVRALRR